MCFELNIPKNLHRLSLIIDNYKWSEDGLVKFINKHSAMNNLFY